MVFARTEYTDAAIAGEEIATNSHCSRNQGGKSNTSTSASWPFYRSIVPALSFESIAWRQRMAGYSENAPRNMNVAFSVGLQRQRGAFIFIEKARVERAPWCMLTEPSLPSGDKMLRKRPRLAATSKCFCSYEGSMPTDLRRIHICRKCTVREGGGSLAERWFVLGA